MPSKLPLATLTDLARSRTDEAARRLGELTAMRENAGQQLEMLRTYRHDYLERLQAALRLGLSAADCHNYQRFIATLDDAIEQQRAVLGQADSQLATGREQWRDAKRKQNSFDALVTRDARRQAVLDARQDQRATDENSARLVRRQTELH